MSQDLGLYQPLHIKAAENVNDIHMKDSHNFHTGTFQNLDIGPLGNIVTKKDVRLEVKDLLGGESTKILTETRVFEHVQRARRSFEIPQTRVFSGAHGVGTRAQKVQVPVGEYFTVGESFEDRCPATQGHSLGTEATVSR